MFSELDQKPLVSSSSSLNTSEFFQPKRNLCLCRVYHLQFRTKSFTQVADTVCEAPVTHVLVYGLSTFP